MPDRPAQPASEPVGNERRFEALAAATAQTVWFTDPRGVVTIDSPSWRAFTGQSWEEYSGYGWLDAVHEADRERARNAWLSAVASRSPYEVEYRTRRHDGAYRWMVARGAPVIDGQGRISEWIGCNWDIHPIKEAEQELERVVEFQQMLLAIVGHDLRNPLGVITVAAATLHTHESPSVRRTAERMTRSALRASQIAGLLLDLAEGKLGRGLPLHRQTIDAAELARDVIAEHDGSVTEREIHSRATGDTRLAADPGRLAQVFGNLIGNALHHGKPGTPVEISVEGHADTVLISVANAADPIPRERLARLFTPFSGSDAPPSSRRNLGLGLYIVKMIVEAHGGSVGVESSPERIVFRARLPRL